MGHAEAYNGTWGGFVDSTYANLCFVVDVGPLDADLEAELTIIDFALYRTMLRWGLDRRYPPRPKDSDRSARVDALVGGRYFLIGTELDFDGPLGASV